MPRHNESLQQIGLNKHIIIETLKSTATQSHHFLCDQFRKVDAIRLMDEIFK